jgi:hypothetical protein
MNPIKMLKYGSASTLKNIQVAWITGFLPAGY